MKTTLGDIEFPNVEWNTDFNADASNSGATLSNGTCPSGRLPYLLSLRDVWGDGWEEGAKITVEALSHEINHNGFRDDDFTVYSGTLPDGFERTTQICLLPSHCFRVVIGCAPSGLCQHEEEMSWFINPIVSSEKGKFWVSKSGNMDCTFASTEKREMEACPWTCYPATEIPTSSPSTSSPTNRPSPQPTNPTAQPSSDPPTASPVVVTYSPGDLNTTKEGLLLSRGLDVRILARKGKPVQYIDGSTSTEPFHFNPDAGATFAISPGHPLYTTYPGGWIYVSNSGKFWKVDVHHSTARYFEIELTSVSFLFRIPKRRMKAWVGLEH